MNRYNLKNGAGVFDVNPLGEIFVFRNGEHSAYLTVGQSYKFLEDYPELKPKIFNHPRHHSKAWGYDPNDPKQRPIALPWQKKEYNNGK